MTFSRNGSFDAGTITFLRTVLEESWACLGPEQRASISKSVLAERILRAASKGERDPARLRMSAIEASPWDDAIHESVGR
jgi:hypothetical protein